MRFLTLLALVAFMLSFGMGSISHAMEPIGCGEGSQTEAAHHFDPKPDPASGEKDKPFSHQHGSCHGHHIAAPIDGTSVALVGVARIADQPSRLDGLVGTPTAPALRPPQA